MSTFRPFLSLVPDAPTTPEPSWSDWSEPAADDWSQPWTAEPAGDESWRLSALCGETDPEAFFPEKGGSTRDAKRVCTGCDVRAECLEFALRNDERFGIWGGLSERERRRLRMQRRDAITA